MIVQASPARMVAPVLMESIHLHASVRPATLVPIVRQVGHTHTPCYRFYQCNESLNRITIVSFILNGKEEILHARLMRDSGLYRPKVIC